MPLLTVRYKNIVLKSYAVAKESSVAIGRLPGNDIVIDNDAVSGSHANIVSKQAEYYIQDLDSTNGTFVNNKRVRTRKLKDEDIIVIGKHEIVFNAVDDRRAAEDGPPDISKGVTSRDKTSALDSRDYKHLMAQNVYDANKATLLTMKFKGRQLRKYVLRKNKALSIGRAATNDIVIENDAVSGKHARIAVTDDEYCIQDLDSTNGTYVNGKPIRTHMLKDQDIIAIGKHELVYCQYETYTLEETLLPCDAGVDYSTDATRAVNLSGLSKDPLQRGAATGGSAPPGGDAAFLSFQKGGEGSVPVPNKGVKIGKDPDADIPLKGFMVGDITLLISKTGGGYYLSFTGKKRGARVNGKTVKSTTKLTDMDTIEIGSMKLVFHNP